MRLDKYICDCTTLSRSDAKKQIKSGLVFINGEVCKKAETNIKENDKVTLGSKELSYRKYVYLMLNKPAGYVSATEDRDHKCVTDLVGEEYAQYDLFPAGRLDIDTEGLVILTNDGDFAHKITSPKKDVYKTYFARLSKAAEDADIKAFADGMEFKDFTAKNAVLEIMDNPCEVIIKISEGKFHQVKRMCEKVGKTVVYLKRLAIGDLKLDESLAMGEYRELSEEEIENQIKMIERRY